MALAISSLPVPVSPVIRIVERLGATWHHQIEHAQHAVALADDVGETVALLQRALELRVFVDQPLARDHRSISISSFSLSQGLGR